MTIVRVKKHPTDLATDKAARPAVLGEAPYFGLMDSPDAASRPRHHRPAMTSLPAALELDEEIGEGQINHLDEQGIQMQVEFYASLAQPASVGQAVAFTADTLDGWPHDLLARPGRKDLP